MHRSRWQSALLFTFMFIIGIFTVNRSWYGEEFVAISWVNKAANRDPAAVKRGLDLSQFSGTETVSLAKERVLRDATLRSEDGKIGISLGHFGIKKEDGQYTLACQLFDKIQITFMADGNAEGGKVPEVQIIADCRIDVDLNHVVTFWVPVESILTNKPSDSEFKFGDENSVNVKVQSIPDQWPKRWTVKSVAFIDSTHANKDLVVQNSVLNRDQIQSLTMVW